MSNWQIVSASVSGSHAEDALSDDALDIRTLADGTILIAVADGASSAAYSRQGAAWAVQSSLDWLQSQELTPEALPNTLGGALHCAHRFIADKGGNIEDYGCTLLLAVITPACAAFSQVGDGFIIGDTDGMLRLLTQPFKGPYVNYTKFITDGGYDEAASTALVDTAQLRALMLMTDGLERVLVRQLTNMIFETPCRQLLDFAGNADVDDHNSELAAWLSGGTVCSHNDDDKTLVLMVPRNSV